MMVMMKEILSSKWKRRNIIPKSKSQQDNDCGSRDYHTTTVSFGKILSHKENAKIVETYVGRTSFVNVRSHHTFRTYINDCEHEGVKPKCLVALPMYLPTL